MSLENLISTYGYAAIVAGTFVEGETILLLGGFAAHRGYLELPWVIVAAFLGTLCGDQFYFYLGRSRGRVALDKRPGWKSKSGKVLSLLEKHQVWLTLGFRFLYGLRTVTPFLIGTSGVAPFRFLALNAIGALVWAIVIGTIGYLFGHALDVLIGDIKRYELLVFAALGAVAVVLWIVHGLSGRKKIG